MNDPRWKVLSSRVVHSSRWFDVRLDDVIQPDDSRTEYHHVVSPGAVTVLAIDADDVVIFTRQWIYTHRTVQWRLPSGGIDPSESDPLVTAKRELAEETGFQARKWTRLGRVHAADSLSDHVDHLFLATGLTAGRPHPGEGESDLEVHRVPFKEALVMVLRQEVLHGPSAQALLMWAALCD